MKREGSCGKTLNLCLLSLFAGYSHKEEVLKCYRRGDAATTILCRETQRFNLDKISLASAMIDYQNFFLINQHHVNMSLQLSTHIKVPANTSLSDTIRQFNNHAIITCSVAFHCYK